MPAKHQVGAIEAELAEVRRAKGALTDSQVGSPTSPLLEPSYNPFSPFVGSHWLMGCTLFSITKARSATHEPTNKLALTPV